nr:MAG: hypothetical protein DIU58_17200 [Sphaerobacter thermophilus]
MAADSVTTGAIAAGAVRAEQIAVDELSAISANLGDVTAGVFRSADNGLVVDATNRLITIRDQQPMPIERVRLGRLGPGPEEWGLQIRSASGLLVLDANGNVGSIVDVPKRAQVVEAMNGQEWVYGDLYSEPPVVAYVGGGLTWDNRNRWGNLSQTYQDSGRGTGSGSLTLSQYGIIPRFFGEVLHEQKKVKFHAFLVAVGTTTPQTATFLSPSQVTLGNFTGQANISAGQLPAVGHNYTVRWRFRAEPRPTLDLDATWDAVARIEVWLGLSNPILLASIWTPTIQGTGPTPSEISGTIAFQRELTASDAVRVKFAALIWEFRSGGSGSVPGTARVDAQGMDWAQAAGALYASATPTDADRARFLVLAQR